MARNQNKQVRPSKRIHVYALRDGDAIENTCLLSANARDYSLAVSIFNKHAQWRYPFEYIEEPSFFSDDPSETAPRWASVSAEKFIAITQSWRDYVIHCGDRWDYNYAFSFSRPPETDMGKVLFNEGRPYSGSGARGGGISGFRIGEYYGGFSFSSGWLVLEIYFQGNCNQMAYFDIRGSGDNFPEIMFKRDIGNYRPIEVICSQELSGSKRRYSFQDGTEFDLDFGDWVSRPPIKVIRKKKTKTNWPELLDHAIRFCTKIKGKRILLRHWKSDTDMTENGLDGKGQLQRAWYDYP